MKNKLNIVSLFSGIGGFEEGLRLAKIKHTVVFASEIDESAQKSYLANFKTNNLFGDITKIDERRIPDHDLLLAGFPCQAFSIAGKMKGFGDTRGTLFYDIARILNEKKPKYILLENVKNLVSHDTGKTIKEILRVLSDLNYTVDFSVINSMEAGVPQNRERTYICGIYDWKSEKYRLDKRNAKVNNLKEKLNKQKYKSFNFFDSLEIKSKPLVLEDILLQNVDEKFYFKSEKVKEFIKTLEIDCKTKQKYKIVKLFDLPREIHNDLERQRRVYSIKGISPTVLARSDSTKILLYEDGEYKIRKITPEENFYIQGFNKKFVDNIRKADISDTQMYKQSGNAVSPPVVANILKKLYEGYMIND
jgi:DNA (cytosine-5)-methyltransferase 1